MNVLIDQIKDLIKNNKFEHFYLFENVLRTYSENFEINAKWIKGNEHSWIIGFCSNNNYNIYGLNYSQEILEEAIKDLDFKLLPNKLCFSGNKEIITSIFNANPNVQYTVYKDRYFYETDLKNFKPFELENILIRYAENKDLEILTEFNCNFFEEEYKGDNNQDFNEMKFQMQFLIASKKFIVGEKDGRIIGFCSRMDTNFKNEMIGTVYIDTPFRNQKAGKFLLSKMTSEILQKNQKCWLMTDVENIYSNKLVEELGYRKIFEYTSGEITNHK
ncbi:hypothetical protein GCM10022422_00810 [Flavobacterium ginsengisoli]|uniref:N-acetyltransferase domain-containing protein n=1 Tax=Flavobacterium ginsengisoli TaxID=871694 RepID=A0ABP7EV21_9FLAO|nr:GNAT family N-acetyltransferase [Flavobacterium ginsengisoli]